MKLSREGILRESRQTRGEGHPRSLPHLEVAEEGEPAMETKKQQMRWEESPEGVTSLKPNEESGRRGNLERVVIHTKTNVIVKSPPYLHTKTGSPGIKDLHV